MGDFIKKRNVHASNAKTNIVSALDKATSQDLLHADYELCAKLVWTRGGIPSGSR